MNTAATADRLIEKPRERERILFKKGDTDDIITVILHADKHSKRSTEKFANELRGKSIEATLLNCWNFVRTHIRYVPDKKGKERIKSPAQTWKDGYADCKSMTILVGSLLKNLNIQFFYRFVGYENDVFVTHVYAVALMGKKVIPVDTVFHKFGKEERFAFKREFMPQISYIHGVGTTARNIPAKKSPKPIINYDLMTDGEFRLVLLDDQLRILQSYYGDQNGLHQKGRNLIFQALSRKGLHQGQSKNFTGSIPSQLQSVAKEISLARQRTRPASTQINKIIRPGGAAQSIGMVQNEVLVPIEDCQAKFLDGRSASQLLDAVRSPEFKECVRQAKLRIILNDHINNLSHQVIYEFITNPNAETQVVTTKSVLHKIWLDQVSTTTGITRDNMRLWLRNGVMRQNVEHGTEPWQPERTIDFIRKKGQEGIGVIPAVVPILGAIAGALTAMAGFILAIKKDEQDLHNQIRNMGQQSASAHPNDFGNGAPGSGTNSIINDPNLPLYLGAAAAGVLLINN